MSSSTTLGEYLLEVRAEEIPARMLPPAMKYLATRVFEDLMGRGLGPAEVETGYTPRRLVLMLRGVPVQEPDRSEQVMGPPTRVAYDSEGKPTKALLGFLERAGVEASAVETVKTEKGEYVAATRHVAGRDVREILQELVPQILIEIPWAKNMRWGTGDGPWVRPVHGVVSLFSGEVVPFRLFDVEAGKQTVGHPVLSPEAFEVRDIEDYKARLAKLGIEIDPRRRAAMLAEVMTSNATAVGGAVVPNDELLTKLAAICEIPGVMDGGFDERFLALPRDVLIASLRDHQSAFTVEKEGELLPRFLTVMDRAQDPSGRVKAGNEWVVEARLADAEFFFGEDRKRGLEERRADLDSLTFHVKLGSYSAKTERVVGLARWLTEHLGVEDQAADAERAAHLAKVDLTTAMVGEFTDLQGRIGGIYARLDGESAVVADAIYDQYLPASSEDPLPRSSVGKILALADRLDTVVGIFGLGLIPTGSRDPFALRRAGQGIVRLALEGELPLALGSALERAIEGYGGQLSLAPELRPFFDDRIRYVLGLHGFAYDEIEAGLASASTLPDLEARVAAIHAVRSERDFLSVVLSAKRIANILKDAEAETLDAGRFEEEAERDLHAAYEELATEVESATQEGAYERALRSVARLAPVLDRFFDEVMVMADDPAVRANRIALLQAIGETISRTAKLTEVVVDKAELRAGGEAT